MKRLLGLFALLWAAGCGRPRTFRNAPVVLISIDTLRADHLPMYGYDKVETPALAALRKDSILYANAVSHVPLTLPSHTTILTGLLPPQSAVRDNTGYVLSASPETLPALLKKNGYATGGAISSVVLVGMTGISRGFDFYDDNVESLSPGQSMSEIQRTGFHTEKIAEDWVRRHESGPFFFFLHLYEPHTPYEPPEPFLTRYADRPYDGEIATADQIVGNYVTFLKREGIYDRALVILLSDHGEGLGEHGEDEHGILLYRPTLHVPLMIKLPGSRRAGETVAGPVGLIDVFPTVVEALGLASPGSPRDRREGVSLLAERRGTPDDRRIYSETLYPRYHFGWSDLSGLTDSRYQYIHAPADEIYDYGADPGETRDLAAGSPPAFRSMRNALLAMDRPRQAPGASDPEQVKKLASLGYLGATSAPENAENLPSPRDHVGEVHALKVASTLASENRFDQALEIARALVRKNPSMADGWAEVADFEHRMGHLPESIDALLKVDRLTPGSSFVFDSLAVKYLEMGNLEQAEIFARRAIAATDTPATHTTLARVLLAKQDMDGAEREAREALVGHEGRRLPTFVLALIARRRGDEARALVLLDALEKRAAETGEPPLVNVAWQRGDILAASGRASEAEAAFREEIRRFPVNLPAWRSLAVLLADEGRGEETRRTLSEMVRTSGNPRAPQVAEQTLRMLTKGAEPSRPGRPR